MAIAHRLVSDDVLDRSSMRFDPATAVKEIVEFFGSGSDKMFGSRFEPQGVPIGGLVMCSSLHAELLNSYRTEVLLARALAARGVAVQRFHYRGHGHSDGESEETTFDGMRRDAVDAVEQLRASARVATPALLGTRWGGLIAAAAAAELPGAPLALWEPIPNAEQFFKEAFRAKRLRDVRERTRSAPSEELYEVLRSGGIVDVVGYPIEGRLFVSSEGRDIARDPGDETRSVFIGQIGTASELRPSYRRAADRWNSLGWPVETVIFKEQEITWFLPDAKSRQENRLALVEATADWLIRQFERGAAR